VVALLSADRPEEHSGEAAVTAVTHDQEISSVGGGQRHGVSRAGLAVHAEYQKTDRPPTRGASIHLRVVVPAGLPVELVKRFHWRPLILASRDAQSDARSDGLSDAWDVTGPTPLGTLLPTDPKWPRR
jgi:hypothetical protein